MVVISAALCTKAGKTLMSRQFVDISRIRIEGLLAAFPKLIGSGGKQHTFVETDTVRYVYQPMESLYLLLITNKSSNIMEDLETLKVLSKIVPEFCWNLDEDGVAESCFDLIFAFDEVLAMGHRENVSLQQVKTAMEMESHEEKIANMIRQSKIMEAKEEAKRQAHAIDKQKAEAKKAGFVDKFSAMSSSGGMGSSSSGPSDNYSIPRDEPVYDDSDRRSAPVRAAPPKSKGKSLVLGGKGKNNDLLQALKDEGEIKEVSRNVSNASAATTSTSSASTSSASRVQHNAGGNTDAPIFISIEEKLSITATRDGGADDSTVTGDLKLTVNDAAAAMTRVQINMKENPAVQFKTHPNINKNLWTSESVLSHKDPPRPFPIGNAIGILKWRATNVDAAIPLHISCWPSVNGREVSMTLEYELDRNVEIQGFNVQIPCPCNPTVDDAEGSAVYNPRDKILNWSIEVIDKTNRNGTLEFRGMLDSQYEDAGADAFFPIKAWCSCTQSFCSLDIGGVSDSREQREVKYSCSKSAEVEIDIP